MIHRDSRRDGIFHAFPMEQGIMSTPVIRNIEYLVCVRTMSGVVQVFGRYTTREQAATIAELVDGWVEANFI
jgi:hypothetical protein